MSIEKKLWGNHNGKDCCLFTIHHRVLVAYRIIAYLNRIGCKSILNIKRQRSGEALLAVNTCVGEHYIGIAVFAVILDIPDLLIEADITAVERVAVVVFGKSIFLAGSE